MRKKYEDVFRNLCKQTGTKIKEFEIRRCSDVNLVNKIDHILMAFNCIRLTESEMDRMIQEIKLEAC